MLAIDRIYLGDGLKLLEDIDNESIDLVICDGPYGVTNYGWDKVKSIQDYNLMLIESYAPKLKEGGTLYLFGKPDCIDFIDYRSYLNLKSKIVWYQPSRLAQGRISYTNNYDVICYFVKGKVAKTFNLDDIRVAQLVELEHRQRCENVPSVKNGKYTKTKFNEKGKNPGDVWGDIKQLTYKSKELVSRDVLNTIQKPEKLYERLIKASSNQGDIVLDTFAGVGTTAVVCKKLKRHFITFEMDESIYKASKTRLDDLDEDNDLWYTFDSSTILKDEIAQPASLEEYHVPN
ncbi:MAG: site-specific DNA-methyltransferase [Candidatus Cloacimonetes bacterium]|nr:site-specific DNA-methyltransferase [Candidatus Cloacimonadota bacterium]